jgi:hypothetical protein
MNATSGTPASRPFHLGQDEGSFKDFVLPENCSKCGKPLLQMRASWWFDTASSYVGIVTREGEVIEDEPTKRQEYEQHFTCLTCPCGAEIPLRVRVKSRRRK